MKTKKEERKIFDSIRKETAPPSRVFKTRKDELPRKRKHKNKIEE